MDRLLVLAELFGLENIIELHNDQSILIRIGDKVVKIWEMWNFQKNVPGGIAYSYMANGQIPGVPMEKLPQKKWYYEDLFRIQI